MITYAKYTNVGERSENEDSVMSIYDENIGYCFVVADGLGGHGRGKEASSMTVDVFKAEFEALVKKFSLEGESTDNNESIVNELSQDSEDSVKKDSDEEISNEVTDEASSENSKITEEVKSEENFDDKKDTLDMFEYLKTSFEKSQIILEEEQDRIKAPNELKTTGVALTICDDKIRWGHIGDSRLYRFNNNKLIDRTLDHSVPQMLVFAGEIKEKKIRNHPDRNRLLRVLGARGMDLKVDYSEEYDIDDCQAFLLCTDGFWECITERKMIKFLRKSSTVEEWLTMMVKEVEKNGKGTNMDNNSAIAIWVKENRSGRLWM